MISPRVAVAFFLVLVLFLFARMAPRKAATWSMLLATMFLPVKGGFDLPLFPPIDKDTAGVVAALLGCLWAARGQLLSARPGTGLDLWILAAAAGTVGTVLTNGETLYYARPVIHGLRPWDIISMVSRDLLAYGLPFFLGRALIRTPEALRDLLRSLVWAGLGYSVLALIEMRISPQLHRWVYGFMPIAFFTTYRLGGYRPMVFMEGLSVGPFMLSATLAAIALQRCGQSILPSVSRLISPYLLMVFVLCRSLASIVYGLVVVPIQWLLGTRQALLAATLLSALVCAYPVMRMVTSGPTDSMVDVAMSFNEARALSLEHRFNTEEALLTRAKKKFLLGWGGFNREKIVAEAHGYRLRQIDGFWIMQLGTSGIIGLVTSMALLLNPIWLAWRRRRRFREPAPGLLVSCMALIVAIRAVDMLPNTHYGPLVFYFGGALYGVVRSFRSPIDAPSTRIPEPPAEHSDMAPPAPEASLEPGASERPVPGRLADLLRRRSW